VSSPPATADERRADLRHRLLAARKRRDVAATAALRAVITAVENAAAPGASDLDTTTQSVIAGSVQGLGTTEVTRLALSGEEVLAVVQAEHDERVAYAAEYERLGQSDAAAELRAEVEVLATIVAEWTR